LVVQVEQQLARVDRWYLEPLALQQQALVAPLQVVVWIG
jgi:hypothetical protein